MIEATAPNPQRARPPDGGDDVVLRTVGLTKRYGGRLAVDALDLEVRRGRVYGFLGPNGAGKTTTIALVLGLIRATAGHVELFGLDTRQHLTATLRRTGSVLEGQSFFPHLSARDNLRVWAKLSGGMADGRIDEVLEQVVLTSRAGDKVRTYSQGMKQRLCVAAALLHDPELVILDEPTNGLDPAGMREFRQLIRELAAAGKTVFVSSHLLTEVELMCDDVGIVKAGRLLREAPVRELLESAQGLEMRVTDTAKAVQLLEALPWVTDVRSVDGLLTVGAPRERAADVSSALASQEVWLTELRPVDNRLEDFFLEVTGEDQGAENREQRAENRNQRTEADGDR